MSLKVMNWAWTLDLPPAPKLVLMALADEADDTGFCFPSQARIARKSSVSDRTVRRIVGSLTTLGYLSVEQRFNRHRGRTSNGYRLHLEAARTSCPGGVAADVRGDRTRVSGGIGHGCPAAPDNAVQVTTTDPPIDPETRPGGSEQAIPAIHGHADGHAALQYPGALTKAQKRAIHARLVGISDDQAQQVLDELAARMATSQIRSPVGYCASLVERLKVGLFVADAGVQISRRRATQQAENARPLGGVSAAFEQENSTSQALPDHLRLALERMTARTSNAPLSDSSNVSSGIDRQPE